MYIVFNSIMGFLEKYNKISLKYIEKILENLLTYRLSEIGIEFI